MTSLLVPRYCVKTTWDIMYVSCKFGKGLVSTSYFFFFSATLLNKLMKNELCGDHPFGYLSNLITSCWPSVWSARSFGAWRWEQARGSSLQLCPLPRLLRLFPSLWFPVSFLFWSLTMPRSSVSESRGREGLSKLKPDSPRIQYPTSDSLLTGTAGKHLLAECW